VVTDGHDQIEKPLKAFLHTVNQYGQAPVQLLATDKPADDRDFYFRTIPTLKDTQDILDGLSPSVPQVDDLPICDVHSSRFKICYTTQDINSNVDSARNLLSALPKSHRIISLDAEWDTKKDTRGMVNWQGTVAVIQLSYRLQVGGEVCALVLHVHGKKQLPLRLAALLAGPTIIFTGRCIASDIAKIAKDFNCETSIRLLKHVDLGPMARARDVVKTGVVALDTLVKVTLKEHLKKSPSVRLSTWSAPKLTHEQAKYAALDVIKALEVFFFLDDLPDLTTRFTPDDVAEGLAVDIVPSHGSVTVLATRAAYAIILPSPAHLVTPNGCKPPKLKATKTRCLVTVTEVLAPSLVIPGIRSDGKFVSLGDFGDTPFTLMLPIHMLKTRVQPPFALLLHQTTLLSCLQPVQLAARMRLHCQAMPWEICLQAKISERGKGEERGEVQAYPSRLGVRAHVMQGFM